MDFPSVYLLVALGVSIFIFCLALAGAIWLFIPRWLVARFPNDPNQEQQAGEDAYRQTLAQILGFPLAAIGVFAGTLGLLQALATYTQSQELEYQNQYSRGFEALASDSMARRIGGLYVLKGLSDNPKLGARTDWRDRNYILMSALSAFAIDKSSPANANAYTPNCYSTEATALKHDLVKADVLVAIQIIAFRKPRDKNVYNLRNGNFPGSILADDPTRAYAYFENSDFYMSNFTGSGLYKANFKQASLRFAHFDGTNLAGAILTGAGISGATFGAGCNFAVPEMVHEHPVRTQLTGSQLDSSFGEKPVFTDAWMVGARLDNAKLIGANFKGAVLDVAHFDGARLDQPDFSDASLQGTEFKGSAIQGAHFVGARIRHVNFTGTGVTSADLNGARLCDVTDTAGNVQPSKCGDESEWTPSKDPVSGK